MRANAADVGGNNLSVTGGVYNPDGLTVAQVLSTGSGAPIANAGLPGGPGPTTPLGAGAPAAAGPPTPTPGNPASKLPSTLPRHDANGHDANQVGMQTADVAHLEHLWH